MQKLLIIFIVFILQQWSFSLAPRSFFKSKEISEYLAVNDYNKQKVKTIIVFGSDDLAVVTKAYKKFKNLVRKSNIKINIIFTGGIAQDTLKLYKNSKIMAMKHSLESVFLKNLSTCKRTFTKNVNLLQVRFYNKLNKNYEIRGIARATAKYLTEAEIFAEIFLELAIKDDFDIKDFNICKNHKKDKIDNLKHNIFLERESVNTTDNIIKTRILSDKYELSLNNIILIQKPLVQRRAYLAAKRHFKKSKNLYNVTYKKFFTLEEIAREINNIIKFGNNNMIATPAPEIYHYQQLLEAA